jgi:isoleucyl-tRNA synthetase
MINRQISIHLQDFPKVDFLEENKDLVKNMDMVRAICSAALSIRDNKNLRVRLPLNKIIVIGKDAKKILSFAEIIQEEVNVKSLETKEEIGDLAELKLQINFKKIGAKYGAKVKEITNAAKNNEWKKISDREIAIAGINLIDDEFELKLTSKNQDDQKFAFATLPSNDGLIQLDIEVSKELEDEGIARDIVRAVQQNRKDVNLNITDRIKLEIFSSNPRILEVAKIFENYIKDQILAESFICLTQKPEGALESKLDDGDLFAAIKFSE